MYKFKDNINYVNFFRFDKDLVRNKIWAGLPEASKSIYPVLAVHCDSKGICFPSQDTIAIFSGITRKTVGKGIKGLNGCPGFESYKFLTSRGHQSFRYKIALTPNKKGRSFPLYKCVFESGNWSQLTSSAHSLDIVMRTFASFYSELYCELEDLEYGYDVHGLIESGHYQLRKYDFVNSEKDVLAEFAGISRSATYEALEKLNEEKLIEKTYSINGYDTWKVFIKPYEHYNQSFLNEVTEKRYGSH